MSKRATAILDCASSHLACGVFERSRTGGLVLEKFASRVLAVDAGDEGKWLAAIGEVLPEVLKEAGAPKELLLCVPGSQALTKFVKMPSVDESKREKIVRFEAQQNIPYPLEEVVWDYAEVHDDKVEVEVMLGAVKKDLMEALCGVVARAGVRVAGAVPSTLTLFESYRLNYGEESGIGLAVNVGARSTNLVFVDGERFFARTIPLAGNTVTGAISERVKNSFGQAEELKLQVLKGGNELPEESPSRLAVMDASRAFIDRLHLEVMRSVANYKRQTGGAGPERVLLTGCGSLVPGLVELLAEKSGMKMEVFDGLRKVGLGAGLEKRAVELPLMADLVGAAAGEVEFSLLPRAVEEKAIFKKQQIWVAGAAVCVALALLLPVLNYWNEGARAAARTAELEKRIQPLGALKRVNAANVRKIEEAKKSVEAIEGLVKSKANWINFLGDLQERLVKEEDVWLEKLEVVRGTVEVPAEEGRGKKTVPTMELVVSGRLLDRKNPVSKVSQDSLRRVESLLKSFTESEFVSAVKSERFDNSQPGILRFDFTLVVDPKHPL